MADAHAVARSITAGLIASPDKRPKKAPAGGEGDGGAAKPKDKRKRAAAVVAAAVVAAASATSAEHGARKKRKRESEAEPATETAEVAAEGDKPVDDNDDDDAGDGRRYQRLILFVGQLPYTATREQIAHHFFANGAGKVRVRLLTDKATGKSRGTAFVDVDSPQQLVRALRLHRSRLQGRAINVERTVGGGGNNEKRKAKLSELRAFQGSRVAREVREIVDEFIEKSAGVLSSEDFDDRVIEALCSLPRDTCKQVLDEILVSNIAGAKNRQRWMMGCIKRYLEKTAKGEDFLTLEEEKAGIIAKQKQERANAASAASAAKRSGPPPAGKNGKPQSSKFARGRIGEAS